ncbi:FAD-dependent oxidoreductase [Pusillimonas sp. T2]|uniref:NAD(P)/FAD-dependent oxidoreductase n=1 Tax=Pusillimonas sp. T2 TaxID=1548123 RepID=UPI000B9D27FC|nr:NAD(P)/FAD-dependent oxidoreductase [Pusillimonas sp. T2]OXR50585.1 FAD-dependent oxidoreductase [Pusillimonas sp. T2]
MADTDCIVLGAGVIGLAIARSLARQGRDVLIVESEDQFGSGVSARNSEVIHAGIYYPTNSLKARLCVEGKALLYAHCREYGVAHQQTGKLIVATSANQLDKLKALARQAGQNGVHDLQWLSSEQATALEPELQCLAALWSPSTGIIDSHGLMLSLLGDAQRHGAQAVFRTPLLHGERLDSGLLKLSFGGESPTTLTARTVINATGLQAPDVASRLPWLTNLAIPKAWYCKGTYFGLQGRTPFTHLIYPMPDTAGLGIHLTLDLAGQARFGPDTEWVDTIDYSLDPDRSTSFYAAVRQYWPDLPDGALVPAYTGIRPKIGPPNAPAADFLIAGPEMHGVEGLLHLLGIESPGLTASLAIAHHASQQIDRTLT